MILTKSQKRFVLFSTLIVGMCSIIYELLISTVSSYFLGDSVKQFSIIIGFYLACMGIGSWLSRFIKQNHLYSFVIIELFLGLVGAFSVPLCYIYFSYADFSGFNFFILFIISIIGILTGLEVPLLTSILNQETDDQTEGLSDVLTLDYLGALVATILFPFFLIPFMGVYKSSLLFGFLNISIGVLNFYLFRTKIQSSGKPHQKRIISVIGISMMALIALAFYKSESFISNWNNSIFKHPVIYHDASPYQQIILTKSPNEFRLYLNGAIQFSSKDEYRYHESLIHVAAQQISPLNKVLILGGGEGLAARELLKYPSIDQIDIVELDPEISQLASENPLFTELNERALLNEKVTLHHEDAFTFLMRDTNMYDFIVVDLPDPSNESLSRLYSMTFYTLCQNRLFPHGALVTQATSPELSTNAFWCIDQTLAASDFDYTYPFHASVPSFGDWGFVIASQQPMDFKIRRYIDMRFVDQAFLEHCFFFPKDKKSRETKINQLDQPVLMDYYLEHWHSLQAEAR